MLMEAFPNIPDHIVDLFARSATVEVDLTLAHAPHRLIEFLYEDFTSHLSVLQLNAKSPLSVRVGDQFRLYDRRIIGSFNG